MRNERATSMARATRTSETEERGDLTPAVLRFLISHLSGRVGRSQLLKLVYLADVEARRYLGRPLTSLRYTWQPGGPSDKAFDRHLDVLRSEGSIIDEPVAWRARVSAPLYAFIGPIAATPFTRGEEAVLDYIARSYVSTKLGPLIDEMIEDTEPVRLARRAHRLGARLAMSTEDNKAREEYGDVDLERLLESEAQMRAGEGRSLDEVERELLGPPFRSSSRSTTR
jgi:hypothetical protein